MRVSLRADDPDSGGPVFTFETGERLVGTDGSLPGLYAVAIGDVLCSGKINLLPERETDALLTIADDGSCSVVGEGSHASSEPHGIAAVGGQLVGTFPPNAMVRVVSRDDPSNAVPDPRGPDEGGHFYFPSLLPGRYDIELVSDAAILDRASIDLAPEQEALVDLGLRDWR